VKGGANVVDSAHSGMGPFAYGTVYHVGWDVPAKLRPGTYTFCVVAVDPAGN
jgi:hypothetical protein